MRVARSLTSLDLSYNMLEVEGVRLVIEAMPFAHKRVPCCILHVACFVLGASRC